MVTFLFEFSNVAANVGLIYYAFCSEIIWSGRSIFIVFIAAVGVITLRSSRFVVRNFMIVHVSVEIHTNHTAEA